MDRVSRTAFDDKTLAGAVSFIGGRLLRREARDFLVTPMGLALIACLLPTPIIGAGRATSGAPTSAKGAGVDSPGANGPQSQPPGTADATAGGDTNVDDQNDAQSANETRPGLECIIPSEAWRGMDVLVVCAVAPTLDSAKATLRFRSASRFSYLSRVMIQSADRRWRGTIPGHMLVDRSVQLYVEISNRARKPLMTWSTKQSPHVLLVRTSTTGAVAEEQTAIQAQAPSTSEVEADENPLDEDYGETTPYRRRRLWVALGIGDGLGWSLENDALASRASPAASLDVHLAPEVGYHLGKRVAVSVAGRHQFVQQPTRVNGLATGAHLGLLRLLGFSGTGRHRLFAAAAVGAGSGFRLVLSQEGGDRAGRPTVRGGPFVGGLSVGYVGDLERSRLAFTIEVGGLAGFPDNAVLVDLRLGMAGYF